MTVLAVTFDGARLNASEANTGWNNWPAGGQAPAAEPNNRFQGDNVVNSKLSSTTLDGLQYTHGSTTDMTAANRLLFFGKVYVTDYGAVDLTYGVSLQVGSADTARANYNVAGSGAKISRFASYPATGGYIVAAINPAVTGWRDSTTGSPTLTAVDWFGAQGDWIAAANAKSENFCFDAIDVGRGLKIVSGTGADPAGKFTDFVAEDQDIIANRWGVVFGAGPLVNVQGMLYIGDSTTDTEFDDPDSVVLFYDGYWNDGDVGVTVDMSRANHVCDIGCSIGSLGADQTEADTRPDHIVTGTAGAYTLTGVLSNHRNIAFTSACDVNGDISYSDLAVDGAHIWNATLRPNSASAVAACDDAVFGASSGVHDCAVIQAGLGHAFAITGDVTLSGLAFAGFGADDSNDAAILVNTTNPVTITLDGTTNMTYRTIGTGNVTISNPKILTIQFDFEGVNPANFEWRLYEDSGVSGELGTVELAGAESKTTFTDETYNYTYTVDEDVVLQVIADGYEEAALYFTLGDANQTQKISVPVDTNL